MVPLLPLLPFPGYDGAYAAPAAHVPLVIWQAVGSLLRNVLSDMISKRDELTIPAFTNRAVRLMASSRSLVFSFGSSTRFAKTFTYLANGSNTAEAAGCTHYN